MTDEVTARPAPRPLLPPPRSASSATAEQKAVARTLMMDGVTMFDAGDFRGALERFEKAYALVSVPTVALMIGKAHAKLGHRLEARRFYHMIAQSRPEPGEPAASANARAHAAELEKSLPP
jgi:lipopolysaccharide biosynthesis regulator YciM